MPLASLQIIRWAFIANLYCVSYFGCVFAIVSLVSCFVEIDSGIPVIELIGPVSRLVFSAVNASAVFVCLRTLLRLGRRKVELSKILIWQFLISIVFVASVNQSPALFLIMFVMFVASFVQAAFHPFVVGHEQNQYPVIDGRSGSTKDGDW